MLISLQWIQVCALFTLRVDLRFRIAQYIWTTKEVNFQTAPVDVVQDHLFMFDFIVCNEYL